MIGLGVGHRLRPVHRHPLPRGHCTGAATTGRDAGRDGHGRPGGDLRRDHGGDLVARHVAHGHPAGGRRGPRGVGDRSAHDDQPHTLLPALLALAQERIEITRWRGLLTAGFAAAAMLGAGIGFPPLAAGGAILAAATLLVSFAVRPLRRQVPRRRAKPVRQTCRLPMESHDPAPAMAVARRRDGRAADPGVPHPRPAPRVADESNHPEGTYTREAYDLLAEGFGDGFNGPFLITVVPRCRC